MLSISTQKRIKIKKKKEKKEKASRDEAECKNEKDQGKGTYTVKSIDRESRDRVLSPFTRSELLFLKIEVELKNSKKGLRFPIYKVLDCPDSRYLMVGLPFPRWIQLSPTIYHLE